MAWWIGRLLLVTVLVVVSVPECFGRRGHHGGGGGGGSGSGSHEDDDDRQEDTKEWAWGAAAGMAAIFGLAVAGAALFSLIAWATCALHGRCRRDRVNASRINVKGGGSSPVPPSWTTQLVYKPEMAVGFGTVSDGFLRLGPAHLVRNRTGTSVTDGAKWAVGMTRGKHVFEITWPWGHRGYHATVGVATGDSPVKCRGSRALVGSTGKTSWGLDIVKRKVVHNNKAVLTCPTDGSYVPDKFLMYVDMDEGTLGYGNDVTYWGQVVSGLPYQGTQAVYLMVGATKWQSELCVTYKGSAPDGTGMDRHGDKPPHHLPPLYHQAPPSYSEFGGNDSKATPTAFADPSISQPQAPPLEMYHQPSPPTPPPPYSRPPTGFKP